MKMGFIFSSLFWGIILIMLGLSFIFRLPMFRIIIGLIIVYWGLSIITGKSCCSCKTRDKVIFNDSNISAAPDSGRNDVVFGKSTIDFSAIKITDKIIRKDLNTVFGSCSLRINNETPVKINVSTVFANAKLPDGNSMSFGNYTYKTDSYKEGTAYLDIKANVVFGELTVEK